MRCNGAGGAKKTRGLWGKKVIVLKLGVVKKPAE